MSTPYEIPLSSTPQTFTIALGGVTYTLTFRWNTQNAAWTMDIGDAAGSPLVSGIPVITGADLLAQYGYLGFSGQLVAQTDNDPDAVPTFENLGTNGHLFYLSPT
jgi:hypothetical protein